MALVDIDVDIDLALADGFEGSLDIGLQGRLIAFDGEPIVGAGVADGLGDLRIAGDGVDGDHGASKLRPAASFASNRGIAVVSLVLSSTASCPRTRWLLAAIDSPFAQIVNLVNPSSDPWGGSPREDSCRRCLLD